MTDKAQLERAKKFIREHRLFADRYKERPEVIVVPKEKAVTPEFFEALMNFQYGDKETSDKAFEKMKKEVKK